MNIFQFNHLNNNENHDNLGNESNVNNLNKTYKEEIEKIILSYPILSIKESPINPNYKESTINSFYKESPINSNYKESTINSNYKESFQNDIQSCSLEKNSFQCSPQFNCINMNNNECFNWEYIQSYLSNLSNDSQKISTLINYMNLFFGIVIDNNTSSTMIIHKIYDPLLKCVKILKYNKEKFYGYTVNKFIFLKNDSSHSLPCSSFNNPPQTVHNTSKTTSNKEQSTNSNSDNNNNNNSNNNNNNNSDNNNNNNSDNKINQPSLNLNDNSYNLIEGIVEKITSNLEEQQNIKKKKLKKISIGVLYFNSPLRREYSSIIFDPNNTNYQLASECVEKKQLPQLNVYTGFRWKDTQCSSIYYNNLKAILCMQKFRLHIYKYICNEKVEFFEYLEEFFSKKFKFPSQKFKNMPILYGPQGCGKGTYISNMGYIFGETFEKVETTEDITGKFNNVCDDKLLIFLDEFFLSNSKDKRSRFYTLITEDTNRLERKYQERVNKKSYTNFIAATNDTKPIQLDEGWNRRFTPIECSNYFSVNKEKAHDYFKHLNDCVSCNDYAALKCYYYYLKNVCETDKYQKRVLSSNYQIALQDENLKSIGKWLQDVIGRGYHVHPNECQDFQYDSIINRDIFITCEGRNPYANCVWIREISKLDLFENYKDWCKSNATSIEYKQRMFFVKISQIFPSIVEKINKSERKPNGDYIKHKIKLFNGTSVTKNYIILPNLEECKICFEKYFNIPIERLQKVTRKSIKNKNDVSFKNILSERGLLYKNNIYEKDEFLSQINEEEEDNYDEDDSLIENLHDYKEILPIEYSSCSSSINDSFQDNSYLIENEISPKLKEMFKISILKRNNRDEKHNKRKRHENDEKNDDEEKEEEKDKKKKHFKKNHFKNTKFLIENLKNLN